MDRLKDFKDESRKAETIYESSGDDGARQQERRRRKKLKKVSSKYEGGTLEEISRKERRRRKKAGESSSEDYLEEESERRERRRERRRLPDSQQSLLKVRPAPIDYTCRHVKYVRFRRISTLTPPWCPHWPVWRRTCTAWQGSPPSSPPSRSCPPSPPPSPSAGYTRNAAQVGLDMPVLAGRTVVHSNMLAGFSRSAVLPDAAAAGPSPAPAPQVCSQL